MPGCGPRSHGESGNWWMLERLIPTGQIANNLARKAFRHQCTSEWSTASSKTRPRPQHHCQRRRRGQLRPDLPRKALRASRPRGSELQLHVSICCSCPRDHLPHYSREAEVTLTCLFNLASPGWQKEHMSKKIPRRAACVGAACPGQPMLRCRPCESIDHLSFRMTSLDGLSRYTL